MCIRKATHKDFAHIRTLPIQLTARQVTKLQPKHYRVLYQEAAVDLFVSEGPHSVNAFIALRFLPAIDSGIKFLVIEYFGLDRHALRAGVAAEMEEQAAAIATEEHCTALLVAVNKLPAQGLQFFRERGYTVENAALVKPVKAYA